MHVLRVIAHTYRLIRFYLRWLIYRVYWVAVIIARPAGPVLLGILVGCVSWVIYWLRNNPEANVAAVVTGIAAAIILSIIAKTLRHLLTTLPVVSPPLRPKWERRAKQHRIDAVKTRSATTLLHPSEGNEWQGDMAALYERLRPELAALVMADAVTPPVSAPSGEPPSPEPETPETPSRA